MREGRRKTQDVKEEKQRKNYSTNIPTLSQL
jgi:hypothetical protein